MSYLVETLMQEASVGRMLSNSTVARFVPAEIREAVQELVGDERLDLADALVEAGLALHPESDDILAIGSLVAMVRQDWAQSIELLTKLIDVQGANVQPFSHVMLVRSLRSNLDPAAALAATIVGLNQYPEHAELIAEEVALFEMVGMTHEAVAID